jgi:DNA-binding IclR family transcriptional regulator
MLVSKEKERIQPMRGLGRYVRILKLFTQERGEWTIPDIAASLAVPASTVYRTVQDMVAANFLESANEAQYRLAASFIEIDRLIRLTDPLYCAGTPLLRDLVAQARVPCVAVLARLYNETVMCVSQAAAPGEDIATSYERGLPRPLTRGATSKVILAHIPPRRLKLLLEREGAIGSLEQIREELALIRKRGYSVTRGEVDQGLLGVAAPVVVTGRSILGSLSIVVRAADIDPQAEMRLILLVTATARLLTDELTGE